jgi:phosphoglycerate kinase
MNYKTLRDMPTIDGVPVVVRLDFNAPVVGDRVVNDHRIRKALPTIQYLLEKGAKVIILSHIESEESTLRPVFERLKSDLKVVFCEDCIERGGEYIEKLRKGEVLLCENIRLYDGEKKNDEEFAKKLASLGKYYVNDAFSVSHRKHASIVGIPKFLPSFMGLQFEEEITNLSKVFNPPRPFVFILGGAKFDTKLPLVDKFLSIADVIFVGGALANDLYKTLNWPVGRSLVSSTSVNLEAYAHNDKILTPQDVIVTNSQGIRSIKESTHIGEDDRVMDAGPQTIKLIKTLVSQAGCVLWNGPLGMYEDGFREPTLQLAEMISESRALSIVGGGDTVAAIQELEMEDRFDFVSTGGGAMLDYLAKETLPGLDALKDSKPEPKAKK